MGFSNILGLIFPEREIFCSLFLNILFCKEGLKNMQKRIDNFKLHVKKIQSFDHILWFLSLETDLGRF